MPTLLPEMPPLEDRAGWVVRTDQPSPTLEVPAAAKTTYLTHGLFRYAGKLPPPLVAYFLDRYTDQGDIVADPMCGGGTTAIEAVSAGRASLNFDVNPVSRLVTEAVSRPADIDELIAFAQNVKESWEPAGPTDDLVDYFSPDSFGLLKRGLELAQRPVESVLILSIARPASFANTKKINTVVDPAKQPKPATGLLEEALRRFVAGFEDLNRTDPPRSEVGEAAAVAVPTADSSVDFVLLHPPYLTNTAFSESMQLQLQLLSNDPKAVRKSELAYRGSYFHVPNGLHKYLLGWAKVLGEAGRIVRPGGHVAVVVGDGRIEKVRMPIGSITEEFGADLGFRLVERAVHRLNNQTGWTLSRRMTGQHVLVFETS